MSGEDNLTLKDNGILLKIRIAPNSAKNQFIIDGDIIKLKITAQPIEGKANKAVIEYLYKQFKVPKTSIEIVKGDTSKDKTILIKTTDQDKFDLIKQTLGLP